MALFFLTLTITASPHCRCGAGRRADYLPACKGSVDYLATRTCPCPELAAASTIACRSHVYEGKHLAQRGSTKRSCIPRHRASGISAGCEIPQHGIRQPMPMFQNCVGFSF